MREIALKLVKLFIVLTQANSHPMFPEQTGPLALLWGSQLSPPISGLKPRAVTSPSGQMELEDAPQWIRLWFSSFLRCGIQDLQKLLLWASKSSGSAQQMPWSECAPALVLQVTKAATRITASAVQVWTWFAKVHVLAVASPSPFSIMVRFPGVKPCIFPCKSTDGKSE